MTRIVLAFLALSFVGNTIVQDEGTPSLRGLKSVSVSVVLGLEGGSCTRKYPAFSLTEKAIQADVEVKLREAGIGIDQKYYATLIASVEACYSATFTQVSLVEPVMVVHSTDAPHLSGASQYGLATIWDVYMIGQGLDDSKIREQIRDLTNQFINKWLADNGPEPPSNKPKITCRTRPVQDV
jgi:hypothetical protein